MKKDLTYIYAVAKYAKKGKIPPGKALDMIIERILRIWGA